MPVGDSLHVLPGYVGLSVGEGDDYSWSNIVKAVVVNDDTFLARGVNRVTHGVSGDYLCQDDSGDLFAVPAAVFPSRFQLQSSVAQAPAAQVGVAYSLDITTLYPIGWVGADPVRNADYDLPSGLSYSPSTVSGTPDAAQQGAYYQEFTISLEGGTTGLMRLVIPVYPA